MREAVNTANLHLQGRLQGMRNDDLIAMGSSELLTSGSDGEGIRVGSPLNGRKEFKANIPSGKMSGERQTRMQWPNPGPLDVVWLETLKGFNPFAEPRKVTSQFRECTLKLKAYHLLP